MTTVVLVIHLMIAVALVGVVLMQRSEGGALGIGGGGGGGGFLTGRGTANLLTRITAGLAVGFFITSITLSILAKQSRAPTSIFNNPASQPTSTTPAPPTGKGPATTPKPANKPTAGTPPKPSKPANTGPTVPQSK